MDKDFDLVGFGECLVELSEISEGIYQSGLSGDILNSLFYASRMAMRTGLVSTLGTDPFTNPLQTLLRNENINLDLVQVMKERSNGLYMIRSVESGHPQFHFWRAESAARETFSMLLPEELESYVRRSRYFHFTGVGLAIARRRDLLLQLLRSVDEQTITTFDMNVRLQLWDDPAEFDALLSQLAPFVRILFLSDDDDRALYGERSFAKTLEHYLAIGFPLVVLRRGASGCVVATREEFIDQRASKDISVVDSTGAGDAFNAGFILAHGQKKPLWNCAMMGNAVAAAKLSARGGIALDFQRSTAEANYEVLLRE